MNASDVTAQTMAHVAIRREIAALTTDGERLARCRAESADFVVTSENDPTFGPVVTARWTDRIGQRMGLRGKAEWPLELLLNACLFQMLMRDIE